MFWFSSDFKKFQCTNSTISDIDKYFTLQLSCIYSDKSLFSLSRFLAQVFAASHDTLNQTSHKIRISNTNHSQNNSTSLSLYHFNQMKEWCHNRWGFN